MPNLTRRARRRRRWILADQLAASLTSAHIGWSHAERAPRLPDERPAIDGGDADVESPEPEPEPRPMEALPAIWLVTSGAVGRIRASRPAVAHRRAALPNPQPEVLEWPADLDGIAGRIGLEVGPWTGGRCRLQAPGLGSLSITIEPHRGGWEELVFGPDHGGHDDTLDITEESTDLWFGDLYERIDGLGDAAVWAAMARTIRVRIGQTQITVELDVELADPDLELAMAVARSVMTDPPVADAASPAVKRRWGLRRR